MISESDDKLVQVPSDQASQKRQNNVVPLMPRHRDKKDDRSPDRPPDGDDDNPGPSAA